MTHRADLLDLPPDLARERFDAVFSFGVLHHTGDTHAALRNVAALVAPDGILFVYLYGCESLSAPRRALLGLERLALAPLPFGVKRRLIAAVQPRSDVHQAFDCLSPTINTRHSFDEIRGWLDKLGFRQIVRTIEHTELFVRAIKEPEQLAAYLLPLPSAPHWFERYA